MHHGATSAFSEDKCLIFDADYLGIDVKIVKTGRVQQQTIPGFLCKSKREG